MRFKIIKCTILNGTEFYFKGTWVLIFDLEWKILESCKLLLVKALKPSKRGNLYKKVCFVLPVFHNFNFSKYKDTFCKYDALEPIFQWKKTTNVFSDFSKIILS